MEQAPRPVRPWRERVIEGFDRSRLRQETLRAKRKRFRKIRERYGTMILGASLAVGGIGVPMSASRVASEPSEGVETAQRVGREIASGVEEAIPFGGVIEEALPLSEKEVNLVTEKVREDFFKSEVPFGSLIYREAKKNNLDPELVAAVVQTESNFRPTARSGVGATGLMQLMPRTGKWMGARNLTNPVENVKAGTKYLKYLNERFDGNETKVLAAYNAGEGNVRRYGGVPPFKETRNYVKKVSNAQKDFEQKVSGKVAETLEMSAEEVRKQVPAIGAVTE
ncbi:MAG: lytic transglycosylase domain-containing protein [Thermoanaerobaculia bacterium]